MIVPAAALAIVQPLVAPAQTPLTSAASRLAPTAAANAAILAGKR